VAAVALELQLNANMLRVWIKRAASVAPEVPRATERSPLPRSASGFLPVPLGGGPALPSSPSERSIRVQLRKGHSRITVEWPTSAAGACAAWLRELMA